MTITIHGTSATTHGTVCNYNGFTFISFEGSK